MPGRQRCAPHQSRTDVRIVLQSGCFAPGGPGARAEPAALELGLLHVARRLEAAVGRRAAWQGRAHHPQGAQHHDLSRDCRPWFGAVDLLKIDVEGHFIEVLEGIASADTSKVRNIVLEAEYADALGHSRESLCALLRGKGYSVEAKDAAQIMIYAWRA